MHQWPWFAQLVENTIGASSCPLEIRVLRGIVLEETCTHIHCSNRDAIGILTRPDPLPGRINLRACEIAGLGLKNGGSSEDDSHHFFPFVGTDDRHSRDMVGIFLEKTHFIPTCFPIRTLHLRKIREDPYRPLFPFADDEFNLRLKCFDFIGRSPTNNLETERRSPALLKSFNHGRASPFSPKDYLQGKILIQLQSRCLAHIRDFHHRVTSGS